MGSSALRSTTSEYLRMYICTHCNQPVPDPAKLLMGRPLRHTYQCPHGHLLYDRRLLGYTREQSCIGSFFNTLMACAVILAASYSAGSLLTKSHTAWVGCTLLAFVIAGILVISRALKWERQGGAVARLVPRAMGMGVACILAGGGLFAVRVATDLIR